jgi:hypothetical protein
MKYTATERRMLEVMSDGLPHSRDELWKCLADQLSKRQAIRPALSRLRIKLREIGEEVVCELHKQTIYYRHIRLITSRGDETRPVSHTKS